MFIHLLIYKKLNEKNIYLYLQQFKVFNLFYTKILKLNSITFIIILYSFSKCI